MESVGIRREDLTDGLDFSRLPLVSKADILLDQAKNPPFGSMLAVTPDKIKRIHKTSGTSATPFFIGLTQQDISDTYIAAQRAFKAAGIEVGERVVHCLNFNLWSGGVTDYLALEAAGATGVPFGVGNTTSLLNLLRPLGITSISATPSYMLTLARRCREELKIDPSELGLRKGYFGGEGILQIPSVRIQIERDFGMRALDANYGMSEVLSIIGGEDIRRDGLIWHAHGILYPELIDEMGASIPIETGARGELVFSTLRREAQPLFRYRTNDIAEIVFAEKADDGLLRFRFRISGRTDDMIVTRGVNFFPQSLLSVLPLNSGEISSFYRVVRPKPNQDAITVLLETAVKDSARLKVLQEGIRDQVSRLLQVKVDIKWLPIGAVPRQANKMRYLIDDESELVGSATR